MRGILILAMFAASLTDAAWAGYEEVRELTLDTQGIDALNIDAGAGSLHVVGLSGSSKITVTATINASDISDAKALEKIEHKVVLTLEQDGSTADLKAHFHNGFFGWRRRRSIDLEVHLPEGLRLAIKDGTGSIEVENVRGDLSVIDGTGSIALNKIAGNVKIKDGTGSITVSGVGGDISVRDGTGDIKISEVTGSVTVNDGTGDIDVTDVGKNLIIVNSGTGGFRYSNIGGYVDM